MTKPFLKWVGGKTQIMDEIMGRIPADINNYHEPFVGGGSVLFALLDAVAAGRVRVRGKIYASDINENLIWLYRNIQSDVAAVIAEVERLEERCAEGGAEEYFYAIRALFNSVEGESRRLPSSSAMLLFLNKTCFRGMYREGPKGFNVPFGNYKNPKIVDPEHLARVSRLTRDVVFATRPFADALTGLQRGDFVYLDPPYVKETLTSFVAYTAGGFGPVETQALLQRCHEMDRDGIVFLLSNSNAESIKQSLAPFAIHVLECKRRIHSKKPESKTKEVLVTNYAR